MTAKQARFARLHIIEAIDFRHRLGWGADCHRIDPRYLTRHGRPGPVHAAGRGLAYQADSERQAA